MVSGNSYVKKNDYSTFFPYIDLVLGSQINLEIAYAASSYIKSKGVGVVNHTYISAQLPLDVPYFYSLNKSFTDFGLNTFDTVFQIGTNLRYEASLINTIDLMSDLLM